MRIYKIGVKLNEILNSLVKNGQKIQHLTKEDKQKANEHMKKMLNIISLSRNVNQNHSEYHYRLTRKAGMKEIENTMFGKNVEQPYCHM